MSKSITHKKSRLLPNLNPLRGFLATMVLISHVPLMSENFGLPFFNDQPILHKGINAVWVFLL